MEEGSCRIPGIRCNTNSRMLGKTDQTVPWSFRKPNTSPRTRNNPISVLQSFTRFNVLRS